MKNIRIIGLSAVASLILVGCGGASSTDISSATTGTGYYVDSAISGVEYICGSQSGNTGTSGEFTFDINQNCTFKLGDLMLREVNASTLKDGLTILEDAPDVARFLQTIDIDGNASNGIEVSSSAKNLTLTQIPTDDVVLGSIHDDLKVNDEEYQGRVVSVLESQTHLSETREEIKNDGRETQYDVEGSLNPSITRAYFGDKVNNVVVVVDVENMSVLKNIATGNEVTYAAETISLANTQSKKFYVDNRGSTVIDVIDEATNTISKSIGLDFYPRSIDMNKVTEFVVVSGANKTMASVIDAKTDTVLLTVGDTALTASTGHPKWLNSNHFALIDRENQKILTYKIAQDSTGTWAGTLVNSLATPSPVHNIIPPEVHGKLGREHVSSVGTSTSTVFYATAEGTSSVNGAVLKLEFVDGVGLSLQETLDIVPVNSSLTANDTGVHHHNFLADQKTIYVGSKEGTLYVVDYSTTPMRIVKTVQAGKGAGHTAELKYKNLAIVINHTDKFVTLMDTLTHEKIADINVSNIPDADVGVVQTQAHPEYHFSKDGRYFYLFLTEEGAFVKVDLTTKQLAQRLDIGGKLAMGSFIHAEEEEVESLTEHEQH